MVNVRRPERFAPVAATTRPFRLAAGGCLAAALASAPLAWGAVRPAGLWLLIALLGAAALGWCADLLAARRLPALPGVLWLGLAALLVSLAPWLFGVASPTPSPGFTRHHFAEVVQRWPHSRVALDSASALALPAGLGLAFMIAADLGREREWLNVFAVTLVLTAAAVALLAIAQHLSGAPGIYWRNEGRLPGRFWGTFFHHTSAGAYLNTAWPLALGLALVHRAWARPLLAILVLLLAAHATHVSRFPQVAALLVGFVLVIRFGLAGSTRRRLVLAGVLAVSALLGAATGRLDEIAERWRHLGENGRSARVAVPPESEWPKLVRDDLLIPNRYQHGPAGDRGEAQRAALRAITARPWTGHGPGNWTAAAAQHSSDPYVRSFFLYLHFAHQDFLQAATERGAAALVALVVLLPGAVIAVCFVRRSATGSSAWLRDCAAAGLGAVLLQSFLDFPLQIPAIALNAHVLAGLAWAGATPTASLS